jgi:hypothetical protein
MNTNNPQVKIIVLLNGQHMIGKVIREDDKELTVESPAVILTGEDNKESKRMSLAFAPFLPFSSDKVFSFKSNMILTTSIPAEALTNEYNRMFGSGLDIITKPSLIV